MEEPTLPDIRYGPHDRNVLDLWHPSTATPAPIHVYMHGGAFRAGDKRNIPEPLILALHHHGIAVASLNYRFRQQAGYPAAMLDAVRATQFVRANAREWNLDKTRLSMGGSSAGGIIAFWIAYRSDFANPASADPIERESSRMLCLASRETQTTLNPVAVGSFLKGEVCDFENKGFFGIAPEDMETPEAKRTFAEVDFIAMVTADAPPLHLLNVTPNVPITPELDHSTGIHHPVFGEQMKRRLDELGVACEHLTPEDRPDLEEWPYEVWAYQQQAAFIARYLTPCT